MDIRFRFHHLNKLQVKTLSRELDGVTYTQNTDSPADYSAEVALTLSNLDAINMFYVRQAITLSHCDILISVDSQSGAVVTLPTIVNQMLKHIDCPLTVAPR